MRWSLVLPNSSSFGRLTTHWNLTVYMVLSVLVLDLQVRRVRESPPPKYIVHVTYAFNLSTLLEPERKMQVHTLRPGIAERGPMLPGRVKGTCLGFD